MRLEGKTAIVTGGGAGLGQAIARAMAREGAKVVVAGRTQARLEETCQAIRSGGGSADWVVADVSKTEDVKRMVKQVMQDNGRINILVNNAALLSKPKGIEEITEEEWDAVMMVNLKGPFLCCREVVPYMKARRSGKIINVSSIGAFFSFRPVLPYSSSKSGLLGFTKILAVEMAPFGICVNAILPGPVSSGLWEKITSEENKAYFRQRIPMGRVATPEDVASVVCFLGSDEANYVTGESIVIAGGLPGIPFVDF